MSERTPGGLFLPDPEDLPPPAVLPAWANPVPPEGEGFALEAGVASPYFVTDPKRWWCELHRPGLLRFDAEVTLEQLVPGAEAAAAQVRPFLVVAPAFTDDAVTFLVVNKLRGILQVAAVATPLGPELSTWLAGRPLARACLGLTSSVLSVG